ncbi:putative chromate transport protein [Pandoraea thiooxydans]|uniref:Chromate transporter n=1 Tax=Pandoraea thiooxydans TaxID=445709 RepID=A0A0G3EPK4_9BURK|nr:chromate efflux transporter [Pandoraea thiooxydans]AKJ68993.1 chromate transporter [Pandoraea thiooxydans]APR96526.1 putative chromate transport protein [Pandoraea thiooxydans]
MPAIETDRDTTPESTWAIFLVFLRLGLTSFGGPVAHLGYFRHEFVTRRRWLGERSYADLVALCQFLPGPASSQVGMALGLARGGLPGALAAWTGFSLPSAILLCLFALGISTWGNAIPTSVLHGLKVVAVAVVAQAVWGMARNLCTDTARVSIAALAACVVLRWPSAWAQVGVIAVAAAVGVLRFKPAQAPAHDPLPIAVGRRTGVALLAVFFFLLIALPVALTLWPSQPLALFNAFYRAGALVFGGGHVVLPLLQTAVVPPGWVSNETFLAGYGAAQAVPGPLFTFSAFLGASMRSAPNGWTGAALCLAAIFTPSFLLVAGALPFWERLRHSLHTQAAFAGVNAAVVGLLLAALYRPVWTSAIHGPMDFALALVALVALMFWRLPPWLVVLGCAIASGLFGGI